MRRKVEQAGLANFIEVDSAGTAAYHTNEPPDRRATAAAKERGYDLTPLRARKAVPADFEAFDWVLAMDGENFRNLQRICPKGRETRLELFLEAYGSSVETEVPDPYYGGAAGFEHVLDLIEDACDALLEQVKASL